MIAFSLRPLQMDDAPSFAKQLNNKKIWDNLRDGLPFPYSEKDARSFIEMVGQAPLLTCYAIVVDGLAVGNIGFTKGEDVERFSAEVGYYLGEDYWGQGIMSAALKQAAEDYFATTDVIRLFAFPYEYNTASARVLEKAGFTRIGRLTKAAYKNGRFVDMFYYEQLK